MKKMDKKDIQDILGLTPMQEGMLFYYLKEEGDEQYFEQLSLKVSGVIDAKLFGQAWNFVAKSNEMLRATYRWEKIKRPI